MKCIYCSKESAYIHEKGFITKHRFGLCAKHFKQKVEEERLANALDMLHMALPWLVFRGWIEGLFAKRRIPILYDIFGISRKRKGVRKA